MATKTKSKSKDIPKTRPTAESLPSGCEAMLGKAQICTALGISLRTFQGMLSSGDYPKCDTRIGLFPRWRVATHNAWIEAKCSKGV